MKQDLYFYSKNCTTTIEGATVEDAANAINSLGFAFDRETGTLYYTIPAGAPYKRVMIEYLRYYSGTEIETTEWLAYLFDQDFSGEEKTLVLDPSIVGDVIGFCITASENSLTGGSHVAKMYLNEVVQGDYIHPTGSIEIKALPVTPIGFAGMQQFTDISHVQIVVAEIQDNGTVGGSGHVWQSPFYPKEIDYKTNLADLVPLCEGNENTPFNVSFYGLKRNEAGDFEVVRTFVVGEATGVPTFTVTGEALPGVSIESENIAYCLSPVILKINRRENRDIKRVRVEIANYNAEFDFLADRNILEIDLSEYLKTLFANVDLFEFQTLKQTAIVKMFDTLGNVLKVEGVQMCVVYGKRPESEIPDSLRVQWLDKFGALHDVTFKVFQNVAEGSSAQKYTANGEDREDKNGERSLYLAYVNANASQRIKLETIVFSDHVRAYFAGTWKRVKVASTYKNGAGRDKRNFEITIKYAL